MVIEEFTLEKKKNILQSIFDRSNKLDLAMLLWASNLVTAVIECSFEMGK